MEGFVGHGTEDLKGISGPRLRSGLRPKGYLIYARFGKVGEPSGGRMSVPSKVQLMNE